MLCLYNDSYAEYINDGGLTRRKRTVFFSIFRVHNKYMLVWSVFVENQFFLPRTIGGDNELKKKKNSRIRCVFVTAGLYDYCAFFLDRSSQRVRFFFFFFGS